MSSKVFIDGTNVLQDLMGKTSVCFLRLSCFFMAIAMMFSPNVVVGNDFLSII
ncbi:hypothetical protein [Leptothoe sp. PORK10 BA2]|uniref:hypothetical protein n=1 Tax=Leptothoe sp. PORK10 BA2 TaxID=3110254 RepID=UPI002B1F3121|nr:hypothetical protein [Leptothoe sp. PORK10 BA2]MEA5466276.1 hypothetical protein [Leptothoe sp. PORK10 BA2]